jgi:hypothetical protein
MKKQPKQRATKGRKNPETKQQETNNNEAFPCPFGFNCFSFAHSLILFFLCLACKILEQQGP